MKIPNICKNTGLLSVILYGQLIAIIMFCIIENNWKIEVLGQYTIYFQWCLLGIMFISCLLKEKINQLKSWQRIVCFFTICIAVFTAVELVSIQILSAYFYDYEYSTFKFLKRFISFSIFSIFLIRLISLLDTLEKRNLAETESRMSALQARIKPHFLFNSLNTISELVVSAPEHAESAINSLALLFRANLETQKLQHTLANEISLCQRYIELETWRLSSKLDLTWNIEVQDASTWQIPKLLLQPLIENAVIHGQLDDGSVKIRINIRENSQHLSIKIQNSISENQHSEHGNGIAIENIRERLFTLYDDQYKFKIKQTSDKYSVIMQIPKIEFVFNDVIL